MKGLVLFRRLANQLHRYRIHLRPRVRRVRRNVRRRGLRIRAVSRIIRLGIWAEGWFRSCRRCWPHWPASSDCCFRSNTDHEAPCRLLGFCGFAPFGVCLSLGKFPLWFRSCSARCPACFPSFPLSMLASRWCCFRAADRQSSCLVDSFQASLPDDRDWRLSPAAGGARSAESPAYQGAAGPEQHSASDCRGCLASSGPP